MPKRYSAGFIHLFMERLMSEQDPVKFRAGERYLMGFAKTDEEKYNMEQMIRGAKQAYDNKE